MDCRPRATNADMYDCVYRPPGLSDVQSSVRLRLDGPFEIAQR